MRAALLFARRLETDNVLARTDTLSVELYGSLGATGRGHGSDKAVVLGLLGETPETTDPDEVDIKVEQVRASGRLNLLQLQSVRFEPDKALIFHKKSACPCTLTACVSARGINRERSWPRRPITRWAAALSSIRMIGANLR